jgi:anti-anti-sigma factor
MSELATLESRDLGERFVVRVVGEIDIANAQELATTIERSLPRTANVLIIDLSQTKYLDSSGIALLLKLSDRLRARRAELRLVVPKEAPVHAVLALTGLHKVIPIDEELGD